jgi:hypothetical protein
MASAGGPESRRFRSKSKLKPLRLGSFYAELPGRGTILLTLPVSNGSVNAALASLRDSSPVSFALNCFRISYLNQFEW